MNTKRLILAGLAVAAFCIAFGVVTCGWLFKWVYALPPTAIWRNFEGLPLGYWGLVDLGTFLISLIYVIVYAKVGCVFGKSKAVRGLQFGFCLWFVAMIPGMFYTYAFMNIAAGVVVYSLARGLVELLIAGLIIAYIYPLDPESCCK